MSAVNKIFFSLFNSRIRWSSVQAAMKLPKEKNTTYQGPRVYCQVVPDSEFTVSGSLAVTLRVSRLAGMAPLRLTRAGAHWRAEISMPVATRSFLFMIAVNLILMLGLVLDFCEEPKKRVRAGESILQVGMCVLDMLTVLVIANIAVFMGPARMRSLLGILKELHQITSDLKSSPPPEKTEKKKIIALLCFVLWALAIETGDAYNIMLAGLHENKWKLINCLYISYSYADMLSLLVVLQWGGAALGVHAAVVALNDRLRLLRHAKLETESGPTFENLMRPKHVNSLVDYFITQSIIHPSDVPMHTSHVQVKIRHLAHTYERISEVVRQMNEANGTILIVTLFAIFLRLVLTPYYLLLSMYDEDDMLEGVVVVQLSWILFHVSKLLLMVEPCHWTHNERAQTEVLLSQLIVHLSPACDRVSHELNQMAKLVQLSHAKFKPLGIYTLARPLMATVLGGVITYLVIIL